jgi:K+-sensing histidine kinase KdpD
VQRRLIGSILGVATSLALGVAMLPFRSQLSPATTALVLVIPVVVGVTAGGFVAGVVSAGAGFAVDDVLFTRPYGHLQIASGQDWVALAVYVVVMVLVARLVASLDASRADAQLRAREARRLIELSELVVEDRSVDELLRTIVGAVRTAFAVTGVSLLVADGDRLTVAARAGVPLSGDELGRLDPVAGVPVSVGTGPGPADEMRTVALSASGRPIGMLALRGVPRSDSDRELLRTFANHAALALERAQLREQALRSEVLEEVDGLRHALMGSVSHDLQTPLATMKVASSTLCDPTVRLDDEDRRELHLLIDEQTDRLSRLVAGLLDLNRFDAGVLDIRREPTSVAELVSEAVASLTSTLDGRPVVVDVPDGIPEVAVDRVLVGQALVNLIDNANRHAPAGTPLTVAGAASGDEVTLSVTDAGPGVPPDERTDVFDRFVRFDTGGRSGLGLWIAKTFIDAHKGRIWVEDTPAGGACFRLCLPSANAAVPG